MENSNIKLISEDEIKYILEHINDTFSCSWNKEQFKRVVDCNSSITFILKEEDLILGFISINKLYDSLDVLNICVNNGYRHKGYGTKLMKYAIQYSKDINCFNITLEVNIYNTNAINMYNKLGFKIVGQRKDYYFNKDKNTYENAHIMNIKGD